MTDLEDGGGSVETTNAGGDGNSDGDGDVKFDEKRGCKRRLEVTPSVKVRDGAAAATIDINISDGSDPEASMPEPESAANANGNQGKSIPRENEHEKADSLQALDTDPVGVTVEAASHTVKVVGTSSDLPQGMLLEWNSDKTRAVLTIVSEKDSNSGVDSSSADREFRVCLIGRVRIRVVEGSAEVLGHALEPPNHDDIDEDDHINDTDDNEDDSSSSSSSACGVLVTSPYWSSWMTIEANPLSLPCKMVLECVRGPESFKVTAPKRPILLPRSWKTCAESVVRDFCASASASVPEVDSPLYRRPMLDSLEDYEETSGSSGPMNMNRNNYRSCEETGKVGIAMITGAKGVGKSTLLRYLTNRILSATNDPNDAGRIAEVAILDCDVGQPELAPPGLLRLSIVQKPLLQPPYWNLVGETMVDRENDPRREHSCPSERDNESHDENNESGVEVVSSVFFGAATSKVDPTRYIDAVQFLMEKYETEVAHSGSYPIPLLINMDGWVKGLGYQILTALIDSLGPTHLVQILGDTPGQTFELPPSVLGNNDEAAPHAANALALPKVYRLEACQTMQGASLCKIPAFTMRNFRWATYFLPNELQTFDAWDFTSAKHLQTGWIVATNSDKTTTVPHWWPVSTITAVDDINSTANEVGGEDDGEDDDDEEQNDSELNDECRLAQALAREKPYCVPMEAVEAFVIGSDFEDYLRIPNINNGSIGGEIDTDTEFVDRMCDRIFQALNGCIVALCINTLTMESLGYGILRSIDWERRLLYILVPPSVAATSSLSKVKALVGGNLPLPLAMLYRGVYAESFPYLTTLSKQQNNNSAILGSEPMKSRNNIARRGLVNAARNAN